MGTERGNEVSIDKSNWKEAMSEIVEVDEEYNLLIDYKLDFGKDHWQTPDETTELGTGDCEDIAIAKFFSLKAKGFDPYLGYAVMGSREGHMICICNGVVLDCQDRPFNLVFTFNEEAVFVEGKPIKKKPTAIFPQWQRSIKEMTE